MVKNLQSIRIFHNKFFLIILVLLIQLVQSCNSKEETKETVLSDSTKIDIDSTVETVEEQQLPASNNIIHYGGVTDDENKNALETFSPFTQVHSLAKLSIQIKDSLEMLHEVQVLTDPQDSSIFMPYQERAYEAILNYKKMLESGKPLQDKCPSLLELDRTTKPEDKSVGLLSVAGASNFIAHGKFFFLGGAPFIEKIQENDTVFTDLKGNPEVRFETSISENGNFLLNSIYHHKPMRLDISYGPPLGSYDLGPQEVNGIGTLKHTFFNRIPAFFLTEAGLVSANLISITLKLVPEDLGCNSDQPYIEFACSKNIGADEILGIYIPYTTENLTSCTINRPSDLVWTADINGDGVADFACVSGTYSGMISDTMAENLWFVNINGTWKIIDWAQTLDCT
jgi:hypothetical protein